MHPAVNALLGAVGNAERWEHALAGYAASFRAELLGGAFLTGGLEQLTAWGHAFTTTPEVGYWLQSPSSQGEPALLWTGLAFETVQGYMEEFRHDDPLWSAAVAQHARPDQGAWIVTDAALLHTHGVRRTSLYSELLRPFDISARMLGGSRSAPHPVGHLNMMLCRRGKVLDDGFTQEDAERFRAEFDTVQHAAYLHREMTALGASARRLESLMEHLPMGIVFFDTAGRLLHANSRTRVLWARPESTALRSLQRGSLLTSSADAQLRALFKQSLQGRSGCVELPGSLVLVTLSVSDLTTLGLGHATLGVAWVVMERSLDCTAAVNLARDAYRLSPAETELLCMLMRGHSPQVFADARGVRISTARAQMTTLLAKTNTRRQQELVALVSRLMLLTPGQAAAEAIQAQ